MSKPGIDCQERSLNNALRIMHSIITNDIYVDYIE